MVTYQHLEVLLLLDERPPAVALARVNVGVLEAGAHHVVSNLLGAVLALVSALVLGERIVRRVLTKIICIPGR